MSDMSHCWCKTCRQPEYACECDDEDQDLEERSPVMKSMSTLIGFDYSDEASDKAMSDVGKEMRAISDYFANAVRRDQMIRELREALKFYADEKNYDHGRASLVSSDRGKIARQALEPKR
jgi:hypothetical protein